MINRRADRGRAQACALMLVMAACLGAAVSAYGGEQDPRISVSEPVYDFGTVTAGTVLEHVFEIKNAGQGVLEIRKIEPS
jgi:hypothetical protein